MGSTYRSLTVAALMAVAAHAAVVDRIAVIVGKDVITESEVLRDVRITQFLNQQPLELGPQARRAAADRLVDQQLIRNEMQIGRYPEASESEGETMLTNFEHGRFASREQLRAALAKYGITEDELKQYFMWQASVIRFTTQRFLPTIPPTAQGTNEAERSEEKPAAPSVDQQLDEWLKEARANTRVEFKPEAFQ